MNKERFKWKSAFRLKREIESARDIPNVWEYDRGVNGRYPKRRISQTSFEYFASTHGICIASRMEDIYRRH